MAIKLATNTKLAAARILFRLAVLSLRLRGIKGYCVECQRGGLRWTLDLSEGIDLSIFLFGAFECGTARTLRKLAHPGATVLDVGANIGAHTLFLAQAVGPTGRIFAFEPTDMAYTKLVKNIALNPSLSASIFPIQALCVSPMGQGLGPTYASWRLLGHPGAHPLHGGYQCDSSRAVCLTIDAFVVESDIQKIDLIKIDVDGSETFVLEGSRRTIERHKPTLVLECSPYAHVEHGSSFDSMLDLLEELGYRLFCERTGRPLPIERDKLLRKIPQRGSINVIAKHVSQGNSPKTLA